MTAKDRISKKTIACTMFCFIATIAIVARGQTAAGTKGPSEREWWKNAVIYEIYPRSFQDTNGDGIGDLNGITERLDYLEELGVDAIWLTPCYPSPQVDFGYDISDYENIDPRYGTMADFDRLVAEARKHHIRVIMDMVMNHTSDQHKWFLQSRSSRNNPYREAVHASPHRKVGCMDCHEASLATKLRHIRVHLIGNRSEAIRLRDVDELAMVPDCQKCHRKDYAAWSAGPHSATYSQIFADPEHNSKRRLMDDCLRCHGMHFNGPVRELVQPQNAQGPWHIVRPGLADQPAMPCQTCHQMHEKDEPQTKPSERISVAAAPADNSLAFFDRREGMHFAAASLPIPQLYQGPRQVRMNEDARQAICYQCHASRTPDTGTPAAEHHWGPQVASGDDRTPMGVHEGLSCLSCHFGHSQNTTASCKTCHLQMSHCGIDVEKMDTTYANPASKHNIHWVKCTDCHQHGIPKMKPTSASHASASLPIQSHSRVAPVKNQERQSRKTASFSLCIAESNRPAG